MTRAKDISKIVSDANFGGTLDVAGETTLATHLNMGDGDIIKLGASADLTIQHDGSHSYVKDAGTGNLFLDSVAGSAIIRVNDGYNALEAIGGGAVNISHNGNTKIATTSTGVTVTGNVVINGGVVRGERGTASAPPFTFSDDLDTGMFNISNADLGFTVGGTERMRIHSNGVVSASAGVALGVGTANTASNVISDFETGSWTPSFTNVNASATSGTYTKIGNYVFCTAVLQAGGASGDNITGQPFTALRGTGERGTGSVGYHNQNSTESWNVIIEATHINLYHGAGARALTSTQIAFISFSYRTA